MTYLCETHGDVLEDELIAARVRKRHGVHAHDGLGAAVHTIQRSRVREVEPCLAVAADRRRRRIPPRGRSRRFQLLPLRFRTDAAGDISQSAEVALRCPARS